MGSADEQLASAGITHLIEHLTLTTVGKQPYTYNGFVSPLLTVFHCQGRPEDVQHFVAAVTSALTALPLERLADEKRILRAEAANQRRGSWASHLLMRYGAAGPGVIDYPEYGLRRVTDEEVAAWARRWFTAENCALWTSFQPPPDLRWSLPAGERAFAPDPVPLAMKFPNRVEHQVAGVGITMTGERSLELTVGCRILQSRLVDRLRLSMAVAYTPQVSYTQVGGNTAHLLAGSDGAKEDASSTADALLEELSRYCEVGPDPAELAADLERFRVAQLDPQSVVGELHFRCLDRLLSPEALFEEYLSDNHAAHARVTSEGVASAFSAAWQSAMVFVPVGTMGAAAAIPLLPMWSASPVPGSTLTRRAVLPGGAPAGSRLMSNREGLTMVAPPQNRDVSVRYREVAALLTWLNGDRILIGNDGFRLPLRAGEWDGQAELTEQIDATVPSERVVPMDEEGVDAAALREQCEVCRKGPSADIQSVASLGGAAPPCAGSGCGRAVIAAGTWSGNRRRRRCDLASGGSCMRSWRRLWRPATSPQASRCGGWRVRSAPPQTAIGCRVSRRSLAGQPSEDCSRSSPLSRSWRR